MLRASSVGETLVNEAFGDDRYAQFARHHSYDMFYSVIWSTEKKEQPGDRTIDRAANEELWLAKLGSWTEALLAYESTLQRNPNDFEAMLGCMRCLGATGEWKKVLELAEDKWCDVPVTTDGDKTAGDRIDSVAVPCDVAGIAKSSFWLSSVKRANKRTTSPTAHTSTIKTIPVVRI